VDKLFNEIPGLGRLRILKPLETKGRKESDGWHLREEDLYELEKLPGNPTAPEAVEPELFGFDTSDIDIQRRFREDPPFAERPLSLPTDSRPRRSPFGRMFQGLVKQDNLPESIGQSSSSSHAKSEAGLVELPEQLQEALAPLLEDEVIRKRAREQFDELKNDSNLRRQSAMNFVDDIGLLQDEEEDNSSNVSLLYFSIFLTGCKLRIVFISIRSKATLFGAQFLSGTSWESDLTNSESRCQR